MLGVNFGIEVLRLRGFDYNYTYDSMDNMLVNGESSPPLTSTYDVASRITTNITGSAVTTNTFDPNGNRWVVNESGKLTTMSVDFENRLVNVSSPDGSTSYTYAGDGLKRSELVSGILTTIVWDGTSYLQERS